jgi:V8-like Glu-specific endopeptidase
VDSPAVAPSAVAPYLSEMEKDSIKAIKAYKAPERAQSFVEQLDQMSIIVWNGDKPVCSGTYIGQNKVLTARHCVYINIEPGLLNGKPFYIWTNKGRVYRLPKDQNIVMTVQFSNGNRLKAKSVYIYRDNDLAVLELNGKIKNRAAKLAKQAPIRGAGLRAVTFFGGMPGFYTTGALALEHATSSLSQNEVSIANMNLFFGSSGGGIFDDANRLVGVSIEIMTEANISFLVHYEHIKAIYIYFGLMLGANA